MTLHLAADNDNRSTCRQPVEDLDQIGAAAMTITTRPVPYRDAEAALAGVLAWDPAAIRPRPGLLLIHGGGGLDDHARHAVRRSAMRRSAMQCWRATCTAMVSRGTVRGCWRASPHCATIQIC